MKKIFKKIIFFILYVEARLVLFRYQPKIVAISGTVGKTGTKDAIYQVLSSELNVRKNNKSLNSEIGVPLTILGVESGWNNPISWIKNILIGFFQIFYIKNYPKWLVLETGIDHPGDMEKTASWLKPTVAVITAFAEVPSHVEFFESPEEVMREEASLMNYLKDDGFLFLNGDDKNVLKLKSKSKHKVYTYGFEKNDIVASNYNIFYQDNFAQGISFKINYDGHCLPITIYGIVGDQFVYPVLAAMSVGISLGISPVSMSESLTKIKFAPGRMNLLKGKGESLLIDDTYNSSPIAVEKAIESLVSIKNEGQKIAILGDMLEIGRFSTSEHKKIGQIIAREKIDILITVGLRSQSTAEQAIDSGMAQKRVFHFDNSEKAVEKAREYLDKGNLILIKGSQGIRMEKITRALLKEEERVDELLVRQESVWQNK